MASFDELIHVLQEYDVRVSNTPPTLGPRDGYSQRMSSDPQIAGNAASIEQGKFASPVETKPFADEINHLDNGPIMPYPLEHIVDKLGDMYKNIYDILDVIKATAHHPGLSQREEQILQDGYKHLTNQLKFVEKFVSQLDLFMTPA